MELAELLRTGIVRELPNLRGLTEERASVPRGEGKWTPKEELGHLIDSAANNHLRFVGGATSAEFRGPSYAQEEWVRIHGYRDMPWEEIVAFWFQYNRLLVQLIAAIPAARLETPCTVGAGAPVTLGYLIEDYVIHMQHHIDLLLRRETVTQYPRH
jgi:hypothetical protein